MQHSLVSVVVLNWNGKCFLQQCLASVTKTHYPNLEVVVVDNGSEDGSQSFVKRFYPNVTLIENKKNLGSAEGNNKGILEANGKYVVLLNNDTVVNEKWISELLKV